MAAVFAAQAFAMSSHAPRKGEVASTVATSTPQTKRERKNAAIAKHNAAYALKQEIKNGNS